MLRNNVAFSFQKLIILLSCTYRSLASDHSYTIPVEGYETELQDLGEHVEIPETPVKVIKITKTVAVKVPVPYPVKIVEKVPYPVHVAKPYPVPVPQIVHVPQTAAHKPLHAHEALDVGNGGYQQSGHHGNEGEVSYRVHEAPSHEQGGPAYHGNSDNSYNFDSNGDKHLSEGPVSSSYEAPHNYYGYSNDHDGNGSFETKSYDNAIQDYLHKHHPSGGYRH